MRACLIALAVILASCVDFDRAERSYCLQRLDVCGLDNGPHVGRAVRFSASPSAAQNFGNEPPASAVPGTLRFLLDEETKEIGWLADAVSAGWGLRFCAQRQNGRRCQDLVTATGSFRLEAEDVQALGRGGAWVDAFEPGGGGGVARGFLLPEDAQLRIAELLDEESSGPTGQRGWAVVVVRRDQSIGYTVYEGFGVLAYGTGPRFARTSLGSFGNGTSGEIAPFADTDKLLSNQLYLQSGPTLFGQLVEPGSLILHGTASGEGMEPPTDVGAVAHLTVIFPGSRLVQPLSSVNVTWLFAARNMGVTLAVHLGPHGHPEGAGGLSVTTETAGYPLEFTEDDLARRRLFLVAYDPGAGETARAQLLASGERLYGGVLLPVDPSASSARASAQLVVRGDNQLILEVLASETVGGKLMVGEPPAPPLLTIDGSQSYRWTGESPDLGSMVEANRETLWIEGGLVRLEGSLRPVGH